MTDNKPVFIEVTDELREKDPNMAAFAELQQKFNHNLAHAIEFIGANIGLPPAMAPHVLATAAGCIIGSMSATPSYGEDILDGGTVEEHAATMGELVRLNVINTYNVSAHLHAAAEAAQAQKH